MNIECFKCYNLVSYFLYKMEREVYPAELKLNNSSIIFSELSFENELKIQVVVSSVCLS